MKCGNLVGLHYSLLVFGQKNEQTIKVKAWRLRIQNTDGSLISLCIALKNLVPTLMRVGNILVIFDRKNEQSLQDRVTKI